MKKFILLSFGFLGWAFYELSGGADFEPASARLTQMKPVQEIEVAEVAESPVPTPSEPVVIKAASTFVDTDPPLEDAVTRVSLDLTSLQDVLSETNPTEPTGDVVAEDDAGVPVNIGVSLASADTPAIIPSLLTRDEGIAPQNTGTVTTSAGIDVRTVSANRVNVRGGPGTDYGVINKLVRGDEVEVLQDNGDGWVKMRNLDGGPEGWMADFLLAGG